MVGFRGFIAVTLLGMALTGCASAGTSGSSGADSGGDAPSGGLVSPEKVSQAVGVAYQAMTLSVGDFLSTNVDLSNPQASDATSAAKLPRIRKDYDYFHLLVSTLDSDEQLGTNGQPSLAILQAVDSAMSQWVSVREEYLGSVSACFGIQDAYAYADCQQPIFARYETQLVETAGLAGRAIQAVDDSSQ